MTIGLDTIAPKAGKLSLKQLSADEILLSTSKFSDNAGIAGYRIYQDGALVADVQASSNGQLSYVHVQENLTGKCSFYVVAYDNAGLESKRAKATISIKDVTPPDQVDDLSVFPGANEKSTTLTWDVPEDNVGVKSYEIYVDGKKYTSKTNFLTVKKLSAGEHQFSVVAVDKAKNKSVVSDALLFQVADSTAPKAGKVTAKQFSADEILLTTSKFSDNTGIAGYRIFQDGALIANVEADANGQLSYVLCQEDLAGKYSFSVIAYDAMGLESKQAKVSLSIKDMTPPDQVDDLSVLPGANEKSTTLTWDVPEDNVGIRSYEIYVDGKKYTSKTNFLTVKKLSAGEHQFSVVAVDKAKNKSVVSDALLFQVADSTAPKAGKVTAKQVSADEVLLSSSKFSDNVGIVGYRIYLDDVLVDDVAARANGQLNYIYTRENLAGKRTFSIVAYDARGLETKKVNTRISIRDITPPDQVTELSVWPAANEDTTTLTWGIPEDNVGVVSYEIYVDGKKYTSKTNTITIKNLDMGTHRYAVVAVDKAKNKSSISEELEFSVSAAPGIITIGGIGNSQFHDIFDDDGPGSLPSQAVFWDITGTSGNDEVLFSANRSRYIGSIRLGSGNDVIRLQDSSNYNDDSKVIFRQNCGIELGDGNNFIYIGKNTELEDFTFLTSGNGNNTIELNGGDLSSENGSILFGNGNDIIRIINDGDFDMNAGTVNFGNGNNQLILNGDGSTIDSIGRLIFGDGNDFIELSNGASMELDDDFNFCTLTMGAGNDSILIDDACELEVDYALDFGEGTDHLKLNGTLYYNDGASISGLENISGSGTVAVSQVKNSDLLILQQFAAAGLDVVNTQGLSNFTTRDQELADNTLSNAGSGEMESDGGIEYDFWLCSEEVAETSLYGFADTVDYLRFSKNSGYDSLDFAVSNGDAQLELLDANGNLIHSFGEANYAEYDLSDLKNGIYYLKIATPEGKIASGWVEID